MGLLTYLILKNLLNNSKGYLNLLEKDVFLSQRGHLRPFVLYPHFLQCTFIVTAS